MQLVLMMKSGEKLALPNASQVDFDKLTMDMKSLKSHFQFNNDFWARKSDISCFWLMEEPVARIVETENLPTPD